MSVFSIYKTKKGNGNSNILLGKIGGSGIEGMLLTGDNQLEWVRLPYSSCKKVREKVSLSFSSDLLDGSKKFITSIPELKLIYFWRPDDHRIVHRINMENGKLDIISMRNFQKMVDNFDMKKNVNFSIDKKSSKIKKNQ